MLESGRTAVHDRNTRVRDDNAVPAGALHDASDVGHVRRMVVSATSLWISVMDGAPAAA
jgi:hypothetical protein